MKKMTVRRMALEGWVAISITLLPFQISFAQTESFSEKNYAVDNSQTYNTYSRSTSSNTYSTERNRLSDRNTNYRTDVNNISREEAMAAIADAKAALNEFRLEIRDLQRNHADKETIKAAKRVQVAAQKELTNARRFLGKHLYTEAIAAADNSITILEDWDEDSWSNTTFQPLAACSYSDSKLADIANYPPGDGPIVAFGDSLTAGVGATSGNDYISQLEEKLGEDIINAGKAGDTTEDALARLNSDVLSHQPRAVIVWLGGNDILARYYDTVADRTNNNNFLTRVLNSIKRLFGNVPNNELLSTDETFNNLRTIIERIQATGAVTIVVGLDGRPFDRNLSAQYKLVAEETDSLYVRDVLRSVVGRPARTASDLIHPNNAGYELVANRIYPVVACVVDEDGDYTYRTNRDLDISARDTNRRTSGSSTYSGNYDYTY